MLWRHRRGAIPPDDGTEPAGDERGAGLGAAHAWWAEREIVHGVPRDRVRERRRRLAEAEAARASAEARRRDYWSAERLFAMSAWYAGGDDVWDHPQADPYAVLGLAPGATLAEVAAARRRLAKLWHPDRAADGVIDLTDRQRRMAAVNRAYEELRGMIGAPLEAHRGRRTAGQ